ncbi:hypothetical protein Cfor_03938 [Coptotermes formosanus]|jgi:hypothetical protein|uniref:Uncharacterized protein n=1 Tax=Coptotermes formosanus TaxID=36987 RepID=A0A6L2PYY5_COPFO|nr:hypothetical protein Cfor_03938 [Coptotermes formosanus]
MSNRDESVDKVKDLVLKNRRITGPEVANMLQISFKSVQSILEDNLSASQTAPNLCPASPPVLFVHEFLSRTKITAIPHHPYSPDLVPHDHSLFQKPKTTLKRKEVY